MDMGRQGSESKIVTGDLRADDMTGASGSIVPFTRERMILCHLLGRKFFLEMILVGDRF
jgi:hypothetical protein